MYKTRLDEGLREGDLADLVLPLISVDEYVSRIDTDEAIVLGFYVHDEAAAKDLNRFLQKSAVPLLGTDVSPAPDQHGYFLIFVEMMDNERLGDNVTAILHEIATLVDIDEDSWQLRIRNHKGLVPFSIATLEQGIEKAHESAKQSAVIEYLQRSALSNAEFNDTLLLVEGADDSFYFDFVDFNQISKLLHDYKLTEVGVKYDLRSVAKTNKITRLLGENWEASRLGRYVLLNRTEDTRGVLLRL
jgi:hypothetical protein